MSPTMRFAMSLIALLTSASFAVAGPADLLEQAIEENEGVPDRATDKIDNLISQADRLADQKKFDEAIALYEKAYRLSPTNQASYARLLVAKRAAGVMTTQDREALALIEEQQAVEVDQAFRTVRIHIIQARQALRKGDTDLAETKADMASRTLDSLPKYVDTTPYRHELKRLLNATRRKAAKTPRNAERTGAIALDDSKMTITRRVDGRTAAPITLMDTGDEPANVETGDIIDVEQVLDEGQQRHAYEREMAQALRRARTDTILSNNEAAMPFPGMEFPHDWLQKTQRRAQYRDGVIYKSKPFVGKDGQEYYTAVYDLGDLVHPVPNFYASYPGTARQQRFENQDRFWLQYRSQIYGGWADDLAAGLPLLHFFGGIDNNAISTRTDPRETERVMRTLERFLGGQ
ncbi:MAG: hypothetical protein MI923_13190 [Phycisphaerales bacterium]|nr:hypothetical protein [Phycisphaerales bacterium]